MNPFFRQNMGLNPYPDEEEIPRDTSPKEIPQGRVAQSFPMEMGGVLESSPLNGVGPSGPPQVGPKVDDSPLSDEEIDRQIAELEIELGLQDAGKDDEDYMKSGPSKEELAAPSGEELPYSPDVTVTPEKEQILGIVEDGLLAKEGASGDTTGAAATGKKGLTKKLYRQMKRKHGNITQEEARQLYLGGIYDKWEAKDGWDLASPTLKVELIDLGYNAGEGVTTWKGLGGSLGKLKDGMTEADVLLNILDSANIGGKSSKGLAKRRAESYNQVATNPIAELEQAKDGTIIYRDASGNIVFQYKPKNGRHSSSSAGSMPIRAKP